MTEYCSCCKSIVTRVFLRKDGKVTCQKRCAVLIGLINYEPPAYENKKKRGPSGRVATGKIAAIC